MDRRLIAQRMIGLVDLTDLSERCTEGDVEHLCERAREHGTAAVCVWPDFVARAADRLRGSEVRVATVVNFPTGDERAFAAGVLTERALADGAHEIDVVMPYRAYLAGDTVRAAAVLDSVSLQCASAEASMKVILETGEVPSDRVAELARFAVDAGADFIKTSTGKTAVSATPEAVRSMLGVIVAADRPVGLKPSGGIATFEAAKVYLDLADEVMGPQWASPATFRFGASRLLDELSLIASVSSG